MGAGRAPEREGGGFAQAGGLTSPCESVHVRLELGSDSCVLANCSVFTWINGAGRGTVFLQPTGGEFGFLNIGLHIMITAKSSSYCHDTTFNIIDSISLDTATNLLFYSSTKYLRLHDKDSLCCSICRSNRRTAGTIRNRRRSRMLS